MKIYTGRPYPEVQTLTLLYTKDTSSYTLQGPIPHMTNGTPLISYCLNFTCTVSFVVFIFTSLTFTIAAISLHSKF